MKRKLRPGKNMQFLRVRSADFSKPATGSRRMYRAAVNVITVANGAKHSEWGEACAQLQ